MRRVAFSLVCTRPAQQTIIVACESTVDTDQFFGVILETALKKTAFQTREELVELLQCHLTERIAARGEVFHVEIMTGVREFSEWLAPIGITLHSAFVSREHIVAPHAFSCKPRRSLTAREQRQLRELGGRGAEGDGDDVFIVYKTWMRSNTTKGPLLCCPVARASLVASPYPDTVLYREPLPAKNQADIRSLAELLVRPQYRLERGAAALHTYLDGVDHYELPPTDWLQSVGHAGPPVPDTGNAMFAHLPDTSWDFLVTFHRQ